MIALYSAHLNILDGTTVKEIDMHGNTNRNIQISACKNLYNHELISHFIFSLLSPGNYTLNMALYMISRVASSKQTRIYTYIIILLKEN